MLWAHKFHFIYLILDVELLFYSKLTAVFYTHRSDSEGWRWRQAAETSTRSICLTSAV